MNTTQLTTQPASQRHSALVDAAWLAQHLHDPAVRVVAVEVSRAGYDDTHIDGAVLWNVYADLKDADYRLLGPAAMQRLFARSGIGPDSTVVFYGYAPALGCWLANLYGHADARVLNCSLDAWRAAGHPVSTARGSGGSSPRVNTAEQGPEPVAHPVAAPDPRLRAGYEHVLAAIGDPAVTLLDIRTPEEYDGERFWPSGGMEPGGRAGHVPTAVRLPIDRIYDETGAFLDAAELRAAFAAADLDGDGSLITYCTIGGRASTAWFVLTHLLGRENVRVYDGSWAEWGRLPGVPVDTA